MFRLGPTILNQDPLCSYCSVAEEEEEEEDLFAKWITCKLNQINAKGGLPEESASHFLCHCDYFATLRVRIWGKPEPADIDTATVGDIARFIKKISQIPIEYPALTGTTGDGWWTPHCGLSLRGDGSPCPIGAVSSIWYAAFACMKYAFSSLAVGQLGHWLYAALDRPPSLPLSYKIYAYALAWDEFTVYCRCAWRIKWNQFKYSFLERI